MYETLCLSTRWRIASSHKSNSSPLMTLISCLYSYIKENYKYRVLNDSGNLCLYIQVLIDRCIRHLRRAYIIETRRIEFEALHLWFCSSS